MQLIPLGAAVISSSIQGSDGQSNLAADTQYDLGMDSSLSMTDVLSIGDGVSLSKESSLGLNGDGNLREYWDWTTSNGKLKAGTYAYIDNPTTCTYKKSGYIKSTRAYASEKVTTTGGDNILFGCFAANDDQYVASQVSGTSGYLRYSNSAMAYTKYLYTAQSLQSKLGGELETWSWGEEGNIDNEITSKSDLDSAIANGNAFGSNWDSADYYKFYAGAYSKLSLDSDQKAIYNSKSYVYPYYALTTQHLASSNIDEIYLDMSSKSGDPSWDFDFDESSTDSSDDSTTLDSDTYSKDAFASLYAENCKRVTYDGKSYSQSSTEEVVQSAKVIEADELRRESYAVYINDGYGYKSEGVGYAIFDGDGDEIPSYTSGNDISTVSSRNVNVTQKFVLKGYDIGRKLDAIAVTPTYRLEAFTTTRLFCSDDDTGAIPTKQSKLWGTSTATATARAAEVEGESNNIIAKNSNSDSGYSLIREAWSTNDNGPSDTIVQKFTYEKLVKYNTDEYALATTSSVKTL